jgi:UDP-glucose 4-epimerase
VTSLVTGGAGFIGSHLVDALVARGDRVLALDDLSTGRKENIASAVQNGAELVVGDVTDGGSIERLVGDLAPVTVYHLAAQVDVRRAVRDPTFDAAVNVIGTVAMLEAVRQTGGARFVFASTGGAIYGEGDGRELPLSEEADCLPDSPYGQSKLAAEGYVHHYRRVHGIPAVSLRLGNVYGPRQDPFGEAGVVAIFCGRIADGEPPIVFGDGKQTRDYVYVGDVVQAMLAAESQLAKDGTGVEGPYNIGTGRETTVLELVDRIGRIADGAPAVPVMAPAREGEIARISLDSGRAASELSWEPRMDMGDGLERVLAAVRDRASARSRPRTG